MITAYQIHDTNRFIQGLGSILKSVLDFNTYQSSSGSLIDNPIELAFVKSIREPNKHQRALEWERRKKLEEERYNQKQHEQLTRSMERYYAELEKGTHPLVALQGDYKWTASSIVQSPLALLIGVMHALPDDSFGFKCSRNTTELRAGIIKGIAYAQDNATISAVQSFYDGFKLADEMLIFCADTFIYDLGLDYWANMWGGSNG